MVGQSKYKKGIIISIGLLLIVVVAVIAVFMNRKSVVEVVDNARLVSAVSGLNVAIKNTAGEAETFVSIAQLIGNILTEETVQKFGLEIADVGGSYSSMYPDREVLKTSSPATPFSVIVEKDSRTVIEIALGSDMHERLLLNVKDLQAGDYQRLVANIDRDGYLEEWIYPEIGVSIVVRGAGGSREDILGLNIFQPIQANEFENKYGLGGSNSRLLRAYTSY